MDNSQDETQAFRPIPSDDQYVGQDMVNPEYPYTPPQQHQHPQQFEPEPPQKYNTETLYPDLAISGAVTTIVTGIGALVALYLTAWLTQLISKEPYVTPDAIAALILAFIVAVAYGLSALMYQALDKTSTPDQSFRLLVNAIAVLVVVVTLITSGILSGDFHDISTPISIITAMVIGVIGINAVPGRFARSLNEEFR